MQHTLADYLRISTTNPFLMIGPPPPESRPGWVYRDFPKMPLAIWLELISLLGEDQLAICSANSRQLPPAEMCRAAVWVSPLAQERWETYLTQQTN